MSKTSELHPKFAAQSDANGNMLTVHKYNPCLPYMSNQNASQYHDLTLEETTW
jgi:hypothetical protein